MRPITETEQEHKKIKEKQKREEKRDNKKSHLIISLKFLIFKLKNCSGKNFFSEHIDSKFPLILVYCRVGTARRFSC
jgi:hypothetical protein